MTRQAALIERLEVSVYKIPTDAPESDGTLSWTSTTLVLVQVHAGGHRGTGFTYADSATAVLIRDKLTELLIGEDPRATRACFQKMIRALRNLGRPGLCSMAVSAVDTALWDLKGKLLDASVGAMLGWTRDALPVYGSGGFTSYSDEQLRAQLSGWTESGISMVKIKVGREPDRDPWRVQIARDTIGPSTRLFVDANGAYSRKQALAMAEQFAANEVSWFEEPVSSDDLDGLNLLRNRAPAGMDITAGEYGYDLPYFLRMLNAQAVDVLQADITRCGGITGFLGVASLCEAQGIPLSCHCAPALHIQPSCASPAVVHQEYFHDHVRIERMLFDGFPPLQDGCLIPDFDRPGLGLEFKAEDARDYAL